MIYMVVPESVNDAPGLRAWLADQYTRLHLIPAYPDEASANDEARLRAKEERQGYTVRKLSMVNFYFGRP